MEEHNLKSEIQRNLDQVRSRMLAACLRAGRAPEEVTLIAVSKKKPVSAMEEAWEAGARHFGENYVQELTEKMQALSRPAQWHMIGHLQKNKVKYIIGQVAMIHSVDTVSLAEQIEKEAAKTECSVDILLEVNVAGEETKFGFSAADVLSAASSISVLPHLRLLGLMTSAPYTAEPESNRLYFRNLREIAYAMRSEGLLADAGKMPVLSMGMSCDYEVAIEEGATMIRVGTDIFGER